MKMDIGYVCVNYNNSSYTHGAVKSLVVNREHQFHIVVVDNNSDEANVEILRKLQAEHANLEIIFNETNAGYFRGLNVGIARLKGRKPEIEFVVVGNNDLLFPPDFGNSIAENSAMLRLYPVICPDIVTLDGIHQNPHVIERISKIREVVYDIYYSNYHVALLIRRLANLTGRFTDRKDETEWTIRRQIYQGYGACYILGPAFFRNFAQLWAPTFLMGEEFFLSKQLRDLGMSKLYEPSIVVQHRCHAAMDKLPNRKVWEFSRDAHRVYRKHVRVIG
jgi:GT2 family glycosyltransferase